MSLLSMCNQTATVSRPLVTSGTNLSQSKSFSAIYTGVPVSVQPVRSELVVESAQRVSKVTHFIFTPLSLDLQPEDIFTVGADTYKFIGFGDMAGRGAGWKIMVARESR